MTHTPDQHTPQTSAPRARILCIGTHHKTGTIWMRKLWKNVARTQKIPMTMIDSPEHLSMIPETGPIIFAHWESKFPEELWAHPEARFLHIIRDPRDVLLSGYRYHGTAPLHNERFLRLPRKDLGGLNYQSHFNALPDETSRLLFEMLNKHDSTLREMLAWPYDHPHAVDLRYEDLIEDYDCAIFRGALEQLNIEGLDIDQVVQAYWDQSLFGGLATEEQRSAGLNRHVKSGRPAQWKSQLPRTVATLYAQRYGRALRRLGYAENNRWVEECDWMTVLSERDHRRQVKAVERAREKAAKKRAEAATKKAKKKDAGDDGPSADEKNTKVA